MGSGADWYWDEQRDARAAWDAKREALVERIKDIPLSRFTVEELPDLTLIMRAGRDHQWDVDRAMERIAKKVGFTWE